MAAVIAKSSNLWGTGRRKSAIASVRIVSGTGKFTINGLPASDYFRTETQRAPLSTPFKVTETDGKYDVIARVRGGGKEAQSGALILGISRALIRANEDLAVKLKDANLLTRDSRMKERKKYGLHGARRGPQFSKR
ncbi:MAG: 30S ribosomal protein S9 [Planctomycetaceae bacterium]|nr:30S ribosomal protein S9 [Planctomycetaceae bacterium]